MVHAYKNVLSQLLFAVKQASIQPLVVLVAVLVSQTLALMLMSVPISVPLQERNVKILPVLLGLIVM